MNLIVSSRGNITTKRMYKEHLTEYVTRLAKVKNKRDGTLKRWTVNLIKSGKRTPSIHASKVINWAYFDNDIIGDIVYNNAEAIKLSSNKLKSRLVLQDNGVPVPLTYDLAEFNEESEIEYPAIIRPSHHFGGKDFIKVDSYSQVVSFKEENSGTFYIAQYYPKQQEYRVHCGSGRFWITQLKYKEDGTEIEHEIWNRAVSGFNFKPLRWREVDERIVKVALSAVHKLGLDFGAVDVLANPTNTDLPYAVVCEVNTCPGAKDYTRRKYCDYFKWLLSQDSKPDWEDYLEKSIDELIIKGE